MAGHYMKEIFTPLKIFGIKFFRNEENRIYIKVFNRPRKLFF